MILQAIIDMAVGVLSMLLSGLTGWVTIPTDLMSTIGSITGFGSWIVGGDLLLLLVGSVTFWTATKLSIGLALWLWKLLPLT